MLILYCKNCQHKLNRQYICTRCNKEYEVFITTKGVFMEENCINCNIKKRKRVGHSKGGRRCAT